MMLIGLNATKSVSSLDENGGTVLKIIKGKESKQTQAEKQKRNINTSRHDYRNITALLTFPNFNFQ